MKALHQNHASSNIYIYMCVCVCVCVFVIYLDIGIVREK